MRIPIKAVRELARKYDLSHVVIFACGRDGKADRIATWGRTIEDCSQAADWGNLLKDSLGWPESLHAQPSRVRKLQARVKELEKVSFGS